MSLFIQGKYRNVNLDEWEGDVEFDMSSYLKYGWSDLGYIEGSGSVSGSYKGQVWYYEDKDDDLGIWFPTIMMEEDEPRVGVDDDRRNIRPAEINLTGFSITAGIKITF